MKNNSQAFVNQLLVCLLVTIGFGGSIGLGTVWMRHQISTTARANRDLLAEITRLSRLIDEKTTLIESEQRPDELRRLNAEMRLGLVLKNEIPIEHVAEDPVQRLAARAHRNLLTDRAAEPAAIVIKFAQR